MLQDHLDREQLSSLLSGSLPDRDERLARTHLFECPNCEDRIADALGDRLTASPASPPRAGAGDPSLVGLRLRLDNERLGAQRLLVHLETEPLPSPNELLQLDPGFASWGFFERLIDESRQLLTTRPHRARTLLLLAARLSSHLDAELYGSAQIETAKVRAWSNLGNIERVLGDFAAAEKAFRRAEFHYWQSGLDPLDEATLLEFKAVLRRHQSRFAEAFELIEGAIAICAEVNERHRQGRAELVRAIIHLYSGSPEEAAAGFGACLPLIDPSVEPQLPAACLLNQILCLTDADRAEEAEALLPEARREVAAVALDDSDHLRLRLQWIAGRVDLGRGRFDAAESALRGLQDRFLADQLPVDAAFVTLDLAALLVRQGRTAETRELVEEMIPVFQALKIQREALAALIVLQQAAQTEGLTLALVRQTAATLRLSAASGPPPVRG